MGRIVVLLAVASSAVALLLPSAASAAPVKRCGNYAPGGGAGVYNITTRVTSCRQARLMARNFYRGRWSNVPSDSRVFRRSAYRCRNRNVGIESAVLRCTARGGRVVRWEHGA